MIALGAIVLWRANFSCPSCRIGGYLADRLLGLDGFLTRQATRLVCLLGGGIPSPTTSDGIVSFRIS